MKLILIVQNRNDSSKFNLRFSTVRTSFFMSFAFGFIATQCTLLFTFVFKCHRRRLVYFVLTVSISAITCTFELSLQGSWLSNRKGELTISSDTVSGFEPYGSTCTTCSGQPTEFECYQQSGSIYLIR